MSRKLWLCNKGLWYAAYLSSKFERWCSRQLWCTVRQESTHSTMCVCCVCWEVVICSTGQPQNPPPQSHFLCNLELFLLYSQSLSIVAKFSESPLGQDPTVYKAVVLYTVRCSGQGQVLLTVLGDVTITIASEWTYTNYDHDHTLRRYDLMGPHRSIWAFTDQSIIMSCLVVCVVCVLVTVLVLRRDTMTKVIKGSI